MNIRKRDIIVIGECFVEFALDDGGNITRQGLGGDCLTVAAQAARLGSNVDLVSAIGMDPLSDYIRSECEKENINLSYTKAAEGYNGIYAVYPDDHELREFAFYRQGCAAREIGSQDIHEDHIKSARIIHASSITQAISSKARKAVFKAFELGHLHNNMISYDPNLRLRLWSLEDAKEAIWGVLPFIDVMFPSAPDETRALFGYERPIDVIGFLWDHGINVVVVKNGDEGCVVGYDGKIEEIPGIPSKGKNLHYANVGSAFCGGFLNAVASGQNPFKAAKIAVQAASFRLSHPGSVDGLAKTGEIEGTEG